MGLRKKRSIWNWNRNYGRRDAAFTTETGVFKRYLPAGGGTDFGCLFMPASAEQRVPWKNRGAQKRLINRNINKYMKINFTSFLVTEGLIYAAIVAALVGLSGCGKSTILPAASSVLCANGGRDPQQWDSTGKNQFPGASSAHYFSGAAPSPAVTGSWKWLRQENKAVVFLQSLLYFWKNKKKGEQQWKIRY